MVFVKLLFTIYRQSNVHNGTLANTKNGAGTSLRVPTSGLWLVKLLCYESTKNLIIVMFVDVFRMTTSDLYNAKAYMVGYIENKDIIYVQCTSSGVWEQVISTLYITYK
jgi:hypothetical protein